MISKETYDKIQEYKEICRQITQALLESGIVRRIKLWLLTHTNPRAILPQISYEV